MSDVRPRDHRLPRGRHDLSAEEVAANQRWRLVAATAALVAGRGAGQVTGRDIAREAGVSSSTLYRLLGSVDGALLATFEAAGDALVWAIGAVGAEATDGTPEARLVAACEWGAEEPELAAMLGLGPAVALPEIAAARERLIARLTDPFVPRLRCQEGDAEALRRLLAGAVLTTVAERTAGLDPDAARRLGHELAALVG